MNNLHPEREARAVDGSYSKKVAIASLFEYLGIVFHLFIVNLGNRKIIGFKATFAITKDLLINIGLKELDVY